jgi:N-acetyl-alpha-D-muramate 1-phosphate uridylyltransferase
VDRPVSGTPGDPWCAVVLAAGEGTRLRPLTLVRPKALCPVGNVPLLDRALARLDAIGLRGPATVAVNASWLASQVTAHVAGRAHLSVENPGPLGTTGGVARLRHWIDGRPALVVNADAYLAGGGLQPLLDGWDGATVRLLGTPAPAGSAGTFDGCRFAGASLLPWHRIRDLDQSTREPGARELVGAVWRPAEASGALEVIRHPGHFRDTGTPADYLAANLHAAGAGNLIAQGAVVTGDCHRAVIGAGATVHGRLTRAVVWPGAHVGPQEHLVDAVRVVHAGTDLTVVCGQR